MTISFIQMTNLGFQFTFKINSLHVVMAWQIVFDIFVI